MGPLRTMEICTAMRLHWTSGYDFYKYRGRVSSVNQISLSQSRDKKLFHIISKGYKTEANLIFSLIAGYLENDSFHHRMLLRKREYTEKREMWLRRQQNIPYTFRQDCKQVYETLQSGVKFEQFFRGGMIQDFLIYDKIQIESFIILNKLIKFLTKADKSNIIYNEAYEKKVENYSSFVCINKTHMRNILEQELRGGRQM